MKLVEPETNPEKKERLQRALGWTMRDLAVNVLRLTAGGGKHQELFGELVTCLNAWIELNEADLGGGVMNEFAWVHDWRARQYGQEKRWGRGDDYLAADSFEDNILEAALRVVAARLSLQRTHETTQSGKLHEAMRNYERETERVNTKRHIEYHQKLKGETEK